MNDQWADTSGGSILIVDDTEYIQRLLSQMLTSKGYQVQTVGSGAAALATVREAPPDLILLDIMMPEMDGYEVCQRLKADPQTRDIPIIFISALEQTDQKVKAFAVGGVDYVTKPFQIKEVLARVAAHLSLRALQKQLQATHDELARQLEELQARNEELDAFARALAHDLKTPLTSVIGFADMLEKLHRTLADEEVEELLRTIARNGRKMDRIIDELTLLARLRQVERVDIAPLNMAAIVDKALRRLADTIEEHQADVVVPDNWPVALGYGPWVEEVWVNAIRQAIEYGGRPPRVEIGATVETDGGVRFWVWDNGPGLGPEGRTGPLTPSGQYGGTGRGRGLGQVIVRRIMEKLGRRASIESAEDGGSVFSFTLRGA